MLHTQTKTKTICTFIATDHVALDKQGWMWVGLGVGVDRANRPGSPHLTPLVDP